MKIKAFVLTLAALFISSCSSNQLTEQTPDQKKADVYYGQGTNELVGKNYMQALTYLIKAKELNPKDSKIRNNLGMAYYFREQPALAIEELKMALSLDGKNTDAHMNLGSIYMAKNRLKEARAEFEKALADLTFANQYRNYYNLAVLALKEGDRKEALEYLGKAVAERDDYCSAHFMLGEMYSEELRYKEALKSFKNASKGTCISEPEPQYQQAMTLLNLNRDAEAKAKFTEIQDKFASTRFSAMAAIQIKKMNNSSNNKEQPLTRSTQTDEPQAVETPNF
jgi:type IV pilus assembly protein PilF